MGSRGAPASLVAYGLLALQALYMYCVAGDIEEEFLLIQGRFVLMHGDFPRNPINTWILFPVLIFDFTIRGWIRQLFVLFPNVAMSLSNSLWFIVHATGQGFGKVMAHRHVHTRNTHIIMIRPRWANIRHFFFI